MGADNRPVRVPIIVDRLSRPHDRIRQRHEIPDGRSRSDVLEVRSSPRRQTPLSELFQFGIRLRHTRIELAELLGIAEVGRDRLVDGPHDGIIPKRKLFGVRVEADYIAWAVKRIGGASSVRKFRRASGRTGVTCHKLRENN